MINSKYQQKLFPNSVICYFAHLGSESRPVIGSKDKRPASADFDDHHSKKLRGELINYDHHEGNNKILHDASNPVHFLIIIITISSNVIGASAAYTVWH